MPDPDLPPRSVAVVLGTRPEAIKLAGIVDVLGPAARLIATGQHYDDALWGGVVGALGLRPADEALEVGGTSRAEQIGTATAALGRSFAADLPRAVVVQGDTNATVAGALAANAVEVPLVHVEAGLRSHDRAMPEEHNRVVVDHLADLCLAPTDVAVANLAAEGIAGERVALTGNTVVEAVARLLPSVQAQTELLAGFGLAAGGYVLATLHRPENVDERDTLHAVLRELASLPLPVVLPLHPRTAATVARFDLGHLLRDGSLRVVDPLPPVTFLGLGAAAALWVSDSGGLQEEASVLKRPLVVVRRSTERPEVQGTFAELVPPGPEIGRAARAVLDDLPATNARLAALPSPYGDGSASARSVDALRRLLRRRG